MTRFSSVCVVGSGAIGSLCAAHIAQHADVSVLTRREEQARELRTHGLTISGKSRVHAQVHATADAAELPEVDLVILACKATQLRAAMAGLAGRSRDAVVLTLQNGIGAEEVVTAHGPWPVVSGVTFMSGVRHSDVHVEYELDTATWMGPFHGTGTPYEVARTVGDLFDASGLVVEVLPDLRPAQWSKLIFNTAVNCVAAVTDLPHVALFARRDRDSDLGHLVADLVEEGKAVAAAAGIELHEDPWEMNVRAVSFGQTGNEAYAHVPSMLDDVRGGRRTEVDFIAGSLIAEADRLGVPVPFTRALYRLVKARDRSYDD